MPIHFRVPVLSGLVLITNTGKDGTESGVSSATVPSGDALILAGTPRTRPAPENAFWAHGCDPPKTMDTIPTIRPKIHSGSPIELAHAMITVCGSDPKQTMDLNRNCKEGHQECKNYMMP